MANFQDGTRMFLKSAVYDNGVTIPPYSFGTVTNGMLSIWSPVDTTAHMIVINPKSMRVFPYPVTEMVYNAREDRWAELVPAGVGILTAIGHARRLFIGLPLPGDKINISRCDAGWQTSLTYLGVTLDPSQVVLFTGQPTYSVKDRYIQRLERMGYEFVAGGNGQVLHFSLSIPGRAFNHAFCGQDFDAASQTVPVRAFANGPAPILTVPVACKKCAKTALAYFR